MEVVAVSGAAAQNTNNVAIQEDTLRWRIWATSRLDAIRTMQDPRLRFAALWTMVSQFRINFTEGASASRFGPVQKYFTDFAHKTEQEVVQLGYDAFPDQVIDDAKPEIEQLAKTAGIAGWVAPEELGRRLAKSGKSPISQILDIPLSPIAGLQGVGNTPEAINNFTAAARDMTQVVERFPERTRWQLELFLLEAQHTGAIGEALNEAKAFRNEAADLGKTVHEIGQVVEGLSEQLGQAGEGNPPEYARPAATTGGESSPSHHPGDFGGAGGRTDRESRLCCAGRGRRIQGHDRGTA